MPGVLSGGQRQRLAIARALANEPTLLLADEPTGALDSEGGSEVIELFRRLHRGGQTIILVTHDPDVAAAAERVVRMRDGRIVDTEPADRRGRRLSEPADHGYRGHCRGPVPASSLPVLAAAVATVAVAVAGLRVSGLGVIDAIGYALVITWALAGMVVARAAGRRRAPGRYWLIALGALTGAVALTAARLGAQDQAGRASRGAGAGHAGRPAGHRDQLPLPAGAARRPAGPARPAAHGGPRVRQRVRHRDRAGHRRPAVPARGGRGDLAARGAVRPAGHPAALPQGGGPGQGTDAVAGDRPGGGRHRRADQRGPASARGLARVARRGGGRRVRGGAARRDAGRMAAAGAGTAGGVLVHALSAAGSAAVVAVVYLVIVLGLGKAPDEQRRPEDPRAVHARGRAGGGRIPAGQGPAGRAPPPGSCTATREAPDEALRTFGSRMTRAVAMDELLLQLAESLRKTMRLTRAEV